jgi:hypothetical protein
LHSAHSDLPARQLAHPEHQLKMSLPPPPYDSQQRSETSHPPMESTASGTIGYIPNAQTGVLQKVLIGTNGSITPIFEEAVQMIQPPQSQPPVVPQSQTQFEKQVCPKCIGAGKCKDFGGLLSYFASEKPCTLCKAKGYIVKGAYVVRPSGGVNQQFVGVVGPNGAQMMNVVTAGGVSMVSNGEGAATTVIRF